MEYTVNRYDCSRKIMVITNMGCNLDCIYCYEQQKEKHTVFDLDETVNKLSQILKTKTPKGTLIKLLGGEPFLVFPNIKKLCESIWDQNQIDNVLFHATSNGTLIHGIIKDWLLANRHRFTIKLSLDGNKKAHDINRSGSFDKIDIDFFKDAWPEVGIKMTISPRSINYFADSIMFLHQIGFKNIKPNFAEFVDWNQMDLMRAFYRQMMELVDFYLDNPHITPCKYFTIPLRRIIDSKTIFHNCTLGEREIYDYKTGKRYPCMFFLPSICGKKTSEEMMTLDMSDQKNLVEGVCINCVFQNVCQTCYAANYIQRGCSARRNMNICKMQKITFLATSKLLYKKYIVKGQYIPNTKYGVEIYKDIEALSIITEKLQEIEAEYESE